MKKLYLLVLAMLVFAMASAFFLKPGPRSDAPVLAEFASEKEVRYHVSPTWATRLTKYALEDVSFDEAASAVKELESGGCKFDRRTIPMKEGKKTLDLQDRAFCSDKATRKDIGVTSWNSKSEIQLEVWEPIALTDPELQRARREQITQVGPPIRSTTP